MINRPKYNATKTLYKGIKFDSKLECNVYKRMEELGIVPTLQPKYELQPKFALLGQVYRPIEYKADFLITINETDYILDAKGMETPEFKLKKKLFAFKYGKPIITIKSVKAFNEWYGKVAK